MQVDYYGAPTPIRQLAGISVPESSLLVIQPYDKGSMQAIEKAIQMSDLGLPPNNDGKVIRLNIPALTQVNSWELSFVFWSTCLEIYFSFLCLYLSLSKRRKREAINQTCACLFFASQFLVSNTIKYHVCLPRVFRTHSYVVLLHFH